MCEVHGLRLQNSLQKMGFYNEETGTQMSGIAMKINKQIQDISWNRAVRFSNPRMVYPWLIAYSRVVIISKSISLFSRRRPYNFYFYGLKWIRAQMFWDTA